MKCHECRDLLSPYLDNMTSDEENKRITVHLAACSGCYRDMQEMKLMLEGLGFFKGEVPLPAGYTEELHEILLAHKTSLWGKQQALPTPRAGGWIAASVAALAIGGGIWVSSLVPYAQMADSLQKAAPAIFDRQHEQVKNTVEKLLADTAKNMQENQAGTGTQGVTPGGPQQVAVNDPTGTVNPGHNTSTPNFTPSKTNNVSPVVAAETPRIAPVVAMRVTVENLNTAINLVKSEGENQNTMVADVNDSSIHTLTAGRDRIVSIQVPAAQVENWTNWLGGLGDSTAPSKRSEDKTKEYNQLSQQVANLQQQLATKSTDELAAELQAAQKQLQAIKDSLQLVTINVTLHEDLEP